MTAVLILRPEPGASTTAHEAGALGLDAVVTPLFEVTPLDWAAPDPAGFDALMMTSANAARLGGPKLALYRDLPLYTVGPATAAAAREAGFKVAVVGDGGAAALVAAISAGSHHRLLHPCGKHRRAFAAIGFDVRQIPVYQSQAAERLPARTRKSMADGAVILLHSARAAILFSRLVDAEGRGRSALRLIAISPSVAAMAGGGWSGVMTARAPTDGAMLAAARALCESGAP